MSLVVSVCRCKSRSLVVRYFHAIGSVRISNRLSVIALGLAFSTAHAQHEPPWTNEVDRLVEHIKDSLSIIGLSVGIAQHGEVVLAKGYGAVAPAYMQAVNAHTAFLTCSISKLFTATAVMQLVEQGRIHLTDRVADILPEFKLRNRRYAAITVEHLLTHSSGLPWDHELPGCPQDSTALEALVSSMAKDVKLQFVPGARFDGATYSNAGYNLLGRVVEQVSGMSFERYVRTQVLDAVPMPDAAFDTTAYTTKNWTWPMEVAGDTRAVRRFNLYGEEDPAHPIRNGQPLPLHSRRPIIRHEQSPCGGLWSSASDLANWMAHLQRIAEDTLPDPADPVLQQHTLQEMWRTHRTIFNKRTAMGLGWWNYDDPELGRYVFHAGRDPGYSAVLLMWPEQSIGVVVLCNGMYADDAVWNVLGPGIGRLVMGR